MPLALPPFFVAAAATARGFNYVNTCSTLARVATLPRSRSAYVATLAHQPCCPQSNPQKRHSQPLVPSVPPCNALRRCLVPSAASVSLVPLVWQPCLRRLAPFVSPRSRSAFLSLRQPSHHSLVKCGSLVCRTIQPCCPQSNPLTHICCASATPRLLSSR